MYHDYELNGYGRLLTGNVNHYTGNFKNDAKHGYGKQVRADGKVKDGNWKDNKF